MGRTPGADAELAPARRGAGLGSQERCAAGRRQAGPTGSSELGGRGLRALGSPAWGFERNRRLPEERVGAAALKQRARGRGAC